MTYALRRGAAYVCQMDANGSHDAADLPRLIMAAHTADVALGSRWVTGGAVEGWPLRRRLLSRFGRAYASAADLRGDGYMFQVEMTYRAVSLGFEVVELPIVFTDRRVGGSKMSRSIVFEAARRVPLLRLAAVRGRVPGTG